MRDGSGRRRVVKRIWNDPLAIFEEDFRRGDISPQFPNRFGYLGEEVVDGYARSRVITAQRFLDNVGEGFKMDVDETRFSKR